MAIEFSRFASSSVADARCIVAALAPCLHIVHQLPGRVRLKIDLVALAGRGLMPLAGDPNAFLDAVRGVRNVRVNAAARSCIVDYDPGLIADQAWPDLLGGRDTPAAEALTALLAKSWAATGR